MGHQGQNQRHKPKLVKNGHGQCNFPTEHLKAVGDWLYLKECTKTMAIALRASAQKHGLRASARKAEQGGYVIEVIGVL